MKKLMFAALAASMMGLTGCITKDMNDGGDTCLKPMIVKDIVHEKYSVDSNTITAAESLTYIRLFWFWTITWGGTATHVSDYAPVGKISDYFGATPEQKALNGAFANACDQAGCDTLVGTHYRYTHENYFVFGKVTCEATGYPSKLTGVELIPNKTVAPAGCKCK